MSVPPTPTPIDVTPKPSDQDKPPEEKLVFEPPPVPKETDTTEGYLTKLKAWGLGVLAMIVAVVLSSLLMKYLNVPVVIQPPPAIPADAPAESLEGPEMLRFCGTNESFTDPFTGRPWPVRTLPWNIDTAGYVGPPPPAGLTPPQIKEAVDVAFKTWAQALDFDPVMVDDPAKALVVMKFSKIDGRLNILAQSELADGTLRTKSQEYDLAEAWTISGTPANQTIDLVRVVAHELGHVLGLSHDQEGAAALMAPIYSRTIRFPVARDIDRAVALGYKRRVVTGPGPTNPPPAITITVAADPEKLAEALRAVGYKVTIEGR